MERRLFPEVLNCKKTISKKLRDVVLKQLVHTCVHGDMECVGGFETTPRATSLSLFKLSVYRP